MEIETVFVIGMFVCFVTLLFLGLPVAYVLAGTGTLFALLGYLSDQYLGTFTGLDALTLGLVVNRIYKIMDNWILVALPMFIFMGTLLERSGIAERMLVSMQRLFGRVHGGLAVTVVAIGIILAASTGIIGASVVLLTVISLPVMLRQGYSPALASGTIASSGTLGILLPPSIMLIIMADQLSLSVGDLFTAAVFPGLLLGLLYLLYIFVLGFVKPSALPLPAAEKPMDMRALLDVAKAVLPAFALIFAVLGSIFAGLATPTQASGVGAGGALLLAAGYRRLGVKQLVQATRETYKTSSNIFAIFIGATCFALVLRELGGDTVIENAITSLPFGKIETVLIILFAVFLLGFFLDWIEITLIILPLTAPVVTGLGFDFGQRGIDFPVLTWFVMLVAITLQTSFLTPPVGFALFYLKSAAGKTIDIVSVYRGVIPFVILQLIVLGAVVFYPDLAIWLPEAVYGRD